MARWDQPKLGRDQIVLFSPTLEDSVTPDHSVRLKRANNSRQAVSREDKLRQKVAALDEQVESLVEQSLETDRQEDELHGESSPAQLPRPLRDLKARRDRLAAALKKAQAMEAGNKPADQKRTEAEKPAAEKTGEETPGGEKPADAKSADEKSAGQKSADQNPSIETTAGAPGGAEKTSGKSTDAGKAATTGEAGKNRRGPGPVRPCQPPIPTRA